MHNEANVVRLLASSVSASSNLPGILHPQDWKQNGHPPAAMADLAKLSSMAAMAPDMLGAINMLPDCVKLAAISEILKSDCEADARCICRNDGFLQNLLEFILRKCKPTDQDISLHIAQDFCSAVIPSLKDSRKAELTAFLVTFTVAATIIVILRMVARHMSTAKFGLDDVFIVIALFFAYGVNISGLVAIYFGYGLHELMLSFHQISSFLLCQFITEIALSSSITAARLSLLLFYHRIFPMDRFRLVAIFTACTSVIWYIGSVIAIITSCLPVQAFWDRSVPGKCQETNVLGSWITSTELVTSILVIVLPLPWLWQLQLPRAKKIALGGIFLLGSFVCISCVVRLPLVKQIHQADASWSIVPAGIWASVECNLGIASVCLPIMRPLFIKRRAFPVRSTFSKFSFSISQGMTRIEDEESRTDPNLSGKTVTLRSTELIPRIPSLKFPNDYNISFDLPVQEVRTRDDQSKRSSTPVEELWGQNVGAHHPAHQPWGQNVGTQNGNQEWELDFITPGTSPERELRTDGWREQWANE